MNENSATSTLNSSAAEESPTQVAGQENERKRLVTQYRVQTSASAQTHARKRTVDDKHPRRHATLEPTHRTYSASNRNPRRHATLVPICYKHSSFESVGARQSVDKPPEDQDELSVWHDEMFNVLVRGPLCIANCLYIYM